MEREIQSDVATESTGGHDDQSIIKPGKLGFRLFISWIFPWRTEVRYCKGLSTCLKMRIIAKIVKYTQIYLFNFHETILDFESIKLNNFII